MRFGMVSGVGRRMGVLDGGGDRRRGRDSFGMNLGRPLVISGDGDAHLPNYFGEDLLCIYCICIVRQYTAPLLCC